MLKTLRKCLKIRVRGLLEVCRMVVNCGRLWGMLGNYYMWCLSYVTLCSVRKTYTNQQLTTPFS